MSSRRPRAEVGCPAADQLRAELQTLKQNQAFAEGVGTTAELGNPPQTTSAFDQLTPTEQSAASLGVHPDAWCVPFTPNHRGLR